MILIRLPHGVTSIHERYAPCVHVQSREEADRMLETLARDHCQREAFALSYPEALEIERSNIGYWAGINLDWWAMLEIFAHFQTRSPIFGNAYPAIKEAFWAGIRTAIDRRGQPMRPEEIAELHNWTDHLYAWAKKP